MNAPALQSVNQAAPVRQPAFWLHPHAFSRLGRAPPKTGAAGGAMPLKTSALAGNDQAFAAFRTMETACEKIKTDR